MISNLLGSESQCGMAVFQEQIEGIVVHASQGEERESTLRSFPRPAMTTLGLMLDGELRVHPGSDAATAAEFSRSNEFNFECNKACFLLNTKRARSWEREFKRGNHVSKIALSMPTGWLESKLVRSRRYDGGVGDVLNSETSMLSWLPSEKTKERGVTLHTLMKCVADPLELESASLALLSSLLRDFTALHKVDGAMVKSYRDIEGSRILNYIESNIEKCAFESHLSVDAIAQFTGVSPNKVQKTFVASYNKTVNDYIRGRRLELAMQKLSEGSLSIGEVAYQAGYNHVSNFSIAFKKYFGTTPGALKKTQL